MQPHDRIIVIGASAGGIAALLRIVPRLSHELPAPILLVLHIGSNRSQIADILQARGALPAQSAQNGSRPIPGRIYVAPPDQHLLLEEGVIRLFRGPKEHHARPAINPLFRSAALNYGPRAIGVILSGMLDDGAAGLNAIKACGGTTIVQDPDDAGYDSMPRAALAGSEVDHVVKTDALADLLNILSAPLDTELPTRPPEWLRMEHAISLGRAGMPELQSIGVASGLSCPDCGGALFEVMHERPLRFLCHTGHAFSLRSLAATQEQVADAALWSGLRALQEKESILRRLAQLTAAENPESEKVLGIVAEAEAIERYIERMRELVTNAPANTAIEEPSDGEG